MNSPLRFVAQLLLLSVFAALAGCVSPPFISEGIDRDLTPGDVLVKTAESNSTEANPENKEASVPADAQKVLWGGVVIGASNDADMTTIEILSYPLDYLQRPQTEGRSSGRFLVMIESYLETADFPAGSRVTAIGTVNGIENGQVGDATYRYAVLKLESAGDLHRWQASDYYNSSPVGIGIGISISR